MRRRILASLCALTLASAAAAELTEVAPTRNADGSVTLAYNTAAGGWYQVEYSPDLSDWKPAGSSVRAVGATMTWVDDGTLTGAHPASVTKRSYRVRDWGVFNVTVNGTGFTYTDGQRTVTGILVEPAGATRFPALVINHGTGGTAGGYSLQRANEMSPWGLVCIAANLTHQQGATEDLASWGYSPENLARVQACLAVLATRSKVDLSRLALWGHSRGAFATIGCASVLGRQLRAVGFSAGGVLENSGIDDRTGLSEPSFPTLAEAGGITAPTIIFHGGGTPGDSIVFPVTSARLQSLLDSLAVPNLRVVFDTTGLTPASNAHNLHQSHFYTDPGTGILDQWRAWLTTQGVLP